MLPTSNPKTHRPLLSVVSVVVHFREIGASDVFLCHGSLTFHHGDVFLCLDSSVFHHGDVFLSLGSLTFHHGDVYLCHDSMVSRHGDVFLCLGWETYHRGDVFLFYRNCNHGLLLVPRDDHGHLLVRHGGRCNFALLCHVRDVLRHGVTTCRIARENILPNLFSPILPAGEGAELDV